MLTTGSATKEWTTFGTTMLTLVGTLNVSQGLFVAFASGGVGFNRDEVAFTSAGTWAAATVTLGVLLALTGLTVRGGRASARLAAVSVVGLHALTQLAMLRAYPAWSLLMVALDVVMLFVLTVPRHIAPRPSQTTTRVDAPIQPLPTAPRYNSRSDVYQPRHKARPAPLTPVAMPAEAPVDAAEPAQVIAIGHAPVPAAAPEPPAPEPVEPPLLSQSRSDADADEPQDLAGELATVGPRRYVT